MGLRSHWSADTFLIPVALGVHLLWSPTLSDRCDKRWDSTAAIIHRRRYRLSSHSEWEALQTTIPQGLAGATNSNPRDFPGRLGTVAKFGFAT